MQRHTLISCALHDYIEIACMYGYQIKLLLKDNCTMTGKALAINSCEQREYLLIEQNELQRQVELIAIKELEVLTPGAKFQKVSF